MVRLRLASSRELKFDLILADKCVREERGEPQTPEIGDGWRQWPQGSPGGRWLESRLGHLSICTCKWCNCQILWWLSMAIHQIRPFNCLNYSQASFYPFDVVITSRCPWSCKLKIIRVTIETIVKRRVANCAHPTQCNGLRTLWKSACVKIVKLLCALLRLCEHCPLCAGPIMPCQNNYLCSVPSTSSPPVSIVPSLDGNRQASTKKARYILLHTSLWNFQESLVCIAWTQYSCDVWFAYMQGWSISEENSYSVSSSSIRSINLLYCLYMDLPARFLWLSLLIFSKGVNDIISCEEDISLFGYLTCFEIQLFVFDFEKSFQQ